MKEYNDLNIKICTKLHDFFSCSEKYLKNRKEKMSLQDLLKYKIISQKGPSNTRAFFNHYMRNNGIDFNPDTKIVSYNLVVEFIKAGFGIGYVTKEFIKEELKNNELSFAASKFVGIIMQK